MTKVLFVGEINVDVMMGGMETPPIVDREVPCKTYEVVMGGSTMISACTYSMLGGDTYFAGLAGNDDYGEFMLRGMHEFRPQHGPASSAPRKSRTGVTVNMISGNTRTQATYPGTIEEYDGAGLDGSVARRAQSHPFRGRVPGDESSAAHHGCVLETARRLGMTVVARSAVGLERALGAHGRVASIGDLPFRQLRRSGLDDEGGRAGGRRSAHSPAARPCPLVKLGRDGALVLSERRARAGAGKTVTARGHDRRGRYLRLGLPLRDARKEDAGARRRAIRKRGRGAQLPVRRRHERAVELTRT